MKNIIFLVIDAFCYNNLDRKIGNEYTTPFLRNLAKNNIMYSNMYAQAPYTEAALVSILSGENTLEHGGYLFGNRAVKKTVFEKYKKKGYKIISQYSPYVYSKSYLRDVDEYYYTRLISIKILFDYRLSYYKDKFFVSSITKSEYKSCIELLEEEFNTWILQAKRIINHDKTAVLIQNSVEVNNICRVLDKIEKEYATFRNNKVKYIEDIFKNFDNHYLLQLDKEYNKRVPLPYSDRLEAKYQNTFKKMQSQYNSIIRKNDFPDLKYLFNTLISGKRGLKQFTGLVHNYMRYYGNSNLKDYLKSINADAKVEICMKRQFDHALKLIDEANEQGQPALVYLHVQDFHLPTVIHSVDYDDENYINHEISSAIELFNAIDRNYRGNIIADLGARFCDNKVKELFEKLKKKYGENFVLAVTADHGYPSYFNPPRSVIYNQTFVEAFHVPFIVYNCGIQNRVDNIVSAMNCFELLDGKIHNDISRKYILSEYGGPGCPDILSKPIWYTYMDKKYRVSVELLLKEDINIHKLKEVYDIEKDKAEKKNLLKKAKDITEINQIMNIIDRRNKFLREQFGGGQFWDCFFDSSRCKEFNNGDVL